jgi:hypothetical protein
MKRLHPYGRHSSKPQGKGDSRRRQTDPWPAYCKRKGLTLDTSLDLYDDDVSAFHGDNLEFGKLARFRELVRIGTVPPGSALGIDNLDRFSRAGNRKAMKVLYELVEAGIEVHVLHPETVYDQHTIDSLTGQVGAVLEFWRAHEESANKSRMVRAAFDKKRENLSEKPFTSVCPAWLKINADGTGFEKIGVAVTAVLRVFELAREGFGVRQIIGRLREEQVPSIGKHKDRWTHSYIQKLLNNRAVLGEFQPCELRDGKRVPVGRPRPNYYPAIMEEADFLATRRAVEQRREQPGRRGKQVTNLFTKIVYDASDGNAMCIALAGKNNGERYLAARKKRWNEEPGPYRAVAYNTIERWILYVLDKDLAVEVLRDGPRELEQQIADLTGQLADLDAKKQRAKRRYETAPDSEALLDLILDLERKQKVVAAELERLKREQTNNHVETLGEARGIIGALQDATDEESLDLRTRLKGRILSLIREIWILVEGETNHRMATVQIFFRKGVWLRFTGLGRSPDPIRFLVGGSEAKLTADDDLRKWRGQSVKRSFKPDNVKGSIAFVDPPPHFFDRPFPVLEWLTEERETYEPGASSKAEFKAKKPCQSSASRRSRK